VQDKYEGTDFHAEFIRRNDAVRTAGGSVFLRNLRNYLLHYGVLGFVHHISFSSGNSPLVSEVRLNCAELQAWDGWSAASKSYMMGCGDTVHLTRTVQIYIASTDDLYYWVFAQLETLHGEDIDAANKPVAEFNVALSGAPRTAGIGMSAWHTSRRMSGLVARAEVKPPTSHRRRRTPSETLGLTYATPRSRADATIRLTVRGYQGKAPGRAGPSSSSSRGIAAPLYPASAGVAVETRLELRCRSRHLAAVAADRGCSAGRVSSGCCSRRRRLSIHLRGCSVRRRSAQTGCAAKT
jgi:hypothetical protein